MPDTKCPACGAADRQHRVGRLWDRPQVIYHCSACNRCYAAADGQGVVPVLTDTENDVLRLTLAGLPNKQVAGRLGICVRTVALRRRAVLDKLGAKNRMEMVRKAIELGLAD